MIFLALVVSQGLHDVLQTGLNGLSLGAIYALGAVGLTLVYGILKLTNFAHGDFITFGAHGLSGQRHLGAPLVVGVFWAMAATALLGLLFERTLWGPMRRRHAGFLQLILMSLGLAFVLRAVFTWFWGTEIRLLDVDTTSTVELLGLDRADGADRAGRGRRRPRRDRADAALRASASACARSSDDLDLAETAGIDTRRVILTLDLLRRARRARRRAGGRDDQPPTRARLRATAPDLRSRHPGRHR